jgi:L-asparaginase II
VQSVLAHVTRGDHIESVHHGSIAVVDSTGRLVAHVGNPDLFLYFRSSAKPFQAIPVIESGAADRFGFTPAELALCCASHSGTPEHQRQVWGMLAKLGLDEAALQCGSPSPYDEAAFAQVEAGNVPHSPTQCDCSGKHTGMLAASLQLGYPIDNYLDPCHPLQQSILGLIAEVCGVERDSIALATDGCSLPTFGSTLRAFARSYAILARPKVHADALGRLRDAMMAVPENVGGPGQLVTDLMAAGKGTIVAKSGAEGLICIGIPEQGLGIAIRITDGSFRAHPVVAAEVLRQLDVAPESVTAEVLELHDPTIYNHNRRIVGEIRPAFTLNT